MNLIDRVGKEKLIELLSTKPIREINREYGYSRNALRSARIALGIDAHDEFAEYKALQWRNIASPMVIPDSYDEFKTVNDEWSAYWLGFIFADGCVYECKRNDANVPYRGLRIGLSAKDKCHLEMFSKYSGMKLKELNVHNKQIGKSYPSVYVRKQSSLIADNLIAFGVIPRKSNTDHYMPDLPEHLIPHFVRGYFDGDGCIICKDDGRPKLISILGRKTFLDGICAWLNRHNIKCVFSDRDTYFEMLIQSMLDVNKFYNLIYKDATIYLDRKYNKFRKFQ